MTHRPELISEEWMHELTLEQFKPTSAVSKFKRVHPFPLIHEISLCDICFINGRENIFKRAVNKKLLDTWLWQIHTSNAHAQGKCILLMHEKFTGCTAVHFTDAQVIYWMHGCPSARIICVHALHGANSWSVNKKSTLVSQSDCRVSYPQFIINFNYHKSACTTTSKATHLHRVYFFLKDH